MSGHNPRGRGSPNQRRGPSNQARGGRQNQSGRGRGRFMQNNRFQNPGMQQQAQAIYGRNPQFSAQPPMPGVGPQHGPIVYVHNSMVPNLPGMNPQGTQQNQFNNPQMQAYQQMQQQFQNPQFQMQQLQLQQLMMQQQMAMQNQRHNANIKNTNAGPSNLTKELRKLYVAPTTVNPAAKPNSRPKGSKNNANQNTRPGFQGQQNQPALSKGQPPSNHRQPSNSHSPATQGQNVNSKTASQNKPNQSQQNKQNQPQQIQAQQNPMLARAHPTMPNNQQPFYLLPQQQNIIMGVNPQVAGGQRTGQLGYQIANPQAVNQQQQIRMGAAVPIAVQQQHFQNLQNHQISGIQQGIPQSVVYHPGQNIQFYQAQQAALQAANLQQQNQQKAQQQKTKQQSSSSNKNKSTKPPKIPAKKIQKPAQPKKHDPNMNPKELSKQNSVKEEMMRKFGITSAASKAKAAPKTPSTPGTDQLSGGNTPLPSLTKIDSNQSAASSTTTPRPNSIRKSASLRSEAPAFVPSYEAVEFVPSYASATPKASDEVDPITPSASLQKQTKTASKVSKKDPTLTKSTPLELVNETGVGNVENFEPKPSEKSEEKSEKPISSVDEAFPTDSPVPPKTPETASPSQPVPSSEPDEVSDNPLGELNALTALNIFDEGPEEQASAMAKMAMGMFDPQHFNEATLQQQAEDREATEESIDDEETEQDESAETEETTEPVELDTSPEQFKDNIYPIAFLIKIRDTKECLAKPDFIETGQFPEISSTGNSSYVRDIIESQGRLPGQAYRKPSRNYKNKKDKPLSARDNWERGKKKPNSKRRPQKHQHHQHNYHQQQQNLGPFEPLKLSSKSWKEQFVMMKSQKDKVRRPVLALLNKVAPDSYDQILTKFVVCIKRQVEDEIDCQVLICTIFEKSVSEPTFSLLYAKLCDDTQHQLANVFFVNQTAESHPNRKDLKSHFRRSIINMCQSNFQKRTEENDFLGLTDSQKQDQIDSHKKKMLGNIKFIGDLFKNKLIHEKIVHHIVAKLLGKPPNDENQRKMWFNELEACCKLLGTVGKEIDVPKAKQWVDQYFKYLIYYQKMPLIETRIRFMIMGIVDLRRAAWVARRETETVKTKEEIHKQYEQEMKKKQASKRGKYDNHHRRGPPLVGNPTNNRGRGAASAIGIRSTSGRAQSNKNAWGARATPAFASRNTGNTSQDARHNIETRKFLSKQGSVTSDNKRNIRPGFSGRSPRGVADRVASSPRSAPPAKKAPSKKDLDTKFKEDVVQGNTKELDDKKVDKWLETPSKVVTIALRNIFVWNRYFLKRNTG